MGGRWAEAEMHLKEKLISQKKERPQNEGRGGSGLQKKNGSVDEGIVPRSPWGA